MDFGCLAMDWGVAQMNQHSIQSFPSWFCVATHAASKVLQLVSYTSLLGGRIVFYLCICT